MNNRYAVIPSTKEHALELSPKLRREDREEIWAAHRLVGLQALYAGLGKSEDVFTMMVDGAPEAMYGVHVATVLSDEGHPWLLGSTDFPKHARQFLRGSREYIHLIMKKYSYLYNYVDERNKEGIRWLEWLGFTLSPAEPYGYEGLPFLKFEMREQDVRTSISNRVPRFHRDRGHSASASSESGGESSLGTGQLSETGG